MVEIGANRQPCDPTIRLLFKLVLEIILGVGSCLHGETGSKPGLKPNK